MWWVLLVDQSIRNPHYPVSIAEVSSWTRIKAEGIVVAFRFLRLYTVGSLISWTAKK